MAEAVAGAAVTGLVRATAEGLFTLSSNGRPVDTGRVARCPRPGRPDPRDAFEAAGIPAPRIRQPLVRRTAPSGSSGGGAPTAVPVDQPGRGFAAVQDRTLLVHGTCVVHEDGVKDMALSLVRPAGATFARAVVDMGEQTCFLHALCPTGLTTKVNVATE